MEAKILEWLSTITFKDIVGLLVFFLVLIISYNFIRGAWDKFCEKTKLEFGYQKQRREDHELLIATVGTLAALQSKQDEDRKQSIKHDREIKADLEKLTQLFIDKEIDDMRWEILDFASALSAGRRYSKEQFDHVFVIYDKYEKILEENCLDNGQVTTSMEVIREIYKETLLKGF